MPSVFDRIWTQQSLAIDAVFGSRFVFIPMHNVKTRPAPDPERAEIEITAALIEQPKEIDLEGKRMANNTASPMSSAITAIDFRAAALPYAAKIGDRLRRVDTGALYEVSGVRPDGIARMTVTVFERSSVL